MNPTLDLTSASLSDLKLQISSSKILEGDSKTLEQLGVGAGDTIRIGGTLLGGGFPGLGALWYGQKRDNIKQGSSLRLILILDIRYVAIIFVFTFPFQYAR